MRIKIRGQTRQMSSARCFRRHFRNHSASDSIILSFATSGGISRGRLTSIHGGVERKLQDFPAVIGIRRASGPTRFAVGPVCRVAR